MNTEQPTKRKMSRTWKIILWAIVILFVIAAISKPSGNQQPAASTAAPAAVQAEPVKPKVWTKVAELSGSASKRSDTFRLEGGKQRITYTLSQGTYQALSVYLMDAGKTLDKDGGFPDVSASVSGETMSYRGAGEYYLDVNAANTDWTVVVEEMR